MLWLSGKQKERMDFIQNFRPTSKIQLKQICQWYCNGDIKRAQEMYDYYTKDIQLPDFDPVQPTTIQQLKESANDLMNWVNKNQNTLVQGYEFIRQLIVNKGALPVINAVEKEAEVSESLPPIN